MQTKKDIEETQELRKPEEIPTNAVSLYLQTRSNLGEASDPYRSYELLINSIVIGDSLVKDQKLKREIEIFFAEQKNYPKITDMEYQGDGTYSVGTGTGGTIVVRPEELEFGERHLLRQQCAMILPRLRLLDNKIMSYLVENKIIRSDETEELFLKTLEEELNV
jgi:hypothetical protein